MDPEIVLCDPVEMITVSGCINRNFCSSFLFILPAVYGYIISYPLIVIGSIICFFTSTAHHYYQAQNKTLRKLDIICVNSIAIYFILHCVFNIGCIFYAKIMYLCAAVALLIWVISIYRGIEMYNKYYFLVHMFAVLGIMFYIKAYDQCLNVSTNRTGD